MTSCSAHPPPAGWKCLDCWSCNWPGNSPKGRCESTMVTGPAKSITTCEAASTGAKPLYSTRGECIDKCGGPPGATCYKCNIQPNEKEGHCGIIHPSQNGKPLDTCPDWPGVFATAKECQRECTQVGPVHPVAKCWQSRGPNCQCVLGDAEGPHGPLDACEADYGFYDTQGECEKACETPSHKSNKTIWIIVGVSVAALILLIIIGIIIYFIWKRDHSP